MITGDRHSAAAGLRGWVERVSYRRRPPHVPHGAPMSAQQTPPGPRYSGVLVFVALLVGTGVAVWLTAKPAEQPAQSQNRPRLSVPVGQRPPSQPRIAVDATGFLVVYQETNGWSPDASLEEIAEHWRHPGHR